MANGRETCTQRSHTHRCCNPTPTTATASPTSGPDRNGWNLLFRQFRDELDTLRHQLGSPGGPTELALTVIAEAMAIGEALTIGAAPPPFEHGPDGNLDHTTVSSDEHGVFDGVDCRYLDHRARALRAALHFVDDYVWWGGLRAQAADRLP
jgi:hypothetical protein